MAFSFDTEEVVLTVNGIRKVCHNVQRSFSSSKRRPALIHSHFNQDLLASHSHLPPLALMGLSDIMTPALARDVYADVATLTTHSRPHVRKTLPTCALWLTNKITARIKQVRKRAVLALFRIFERYPEAMRMGFSRLRDRLEDDDAGESKSWLAMLQIEVNPC